MYESPKVKFEEISFFERIAYNRCWSIKSFTFDNPGTCQVEDDPIYIGKGCGILESLSALNQALKYLSGFYHVAYSLYAATVLDKQNTRLEGFHNVS